MSTKDDKPVDASNPLPVLLASGGQGGTAATAEYTKITDGTNQATLTASGHFGVVIRNSSGTELGTTTNPIVVKVQDYTQIQLWNAAAVSANGASATADLPASNVVSYMGNSSAATTIMVQFSHNGTTWYDSTYTQVLSGAGDFGFTIQTGCRYTRLKSTGAATITAFAAGKSG